MNTSVVDQIEALAAFSKEQLQKALTENSISRRHKNCEKTS
jgi:hypothetical protein